MYSSINSRAALLESKEQFSRLKVSIRRSRWGGLNDLTSVFVMGVASLRIGSVGLYGGEQGIKYGDVIVPVGVVKGKGSVGL